MYGPLVLLFNCDGEENNWLSAGISFLTSITAAIIPRVPVRVNVKQFSLRIVITRPKSRTNTAESAPFAANFATALLNSNSR